MSSELLSYRYTHPLEKRENPVVIGGDYITTESGTGLVHTAPGHGQEDYITGQKYGLPLLSPVDDNGDFTSEAGQFAGLNVLGDGNTAVVTALDSQSALLLEEAYGDYRCFTAPSCFSFRFSLVAYLNCRCIMTRLRWKLDSPIFSGNTTKLADMIDWAIIAAQWDIQSWVLAGVLWVSESYC
jgi:hypothetical protein